jgi:starch synthase
VATRVGGVPDVVDDGVTGRLVPPGDAAAAAGAILELLSDPKRAQTIGQAARERVVPRFSVTRLVTDLDDLYRALLRAKGLRTG